MIAYLRTLGSAVLLGALFASTLCWRAALADEAYHRALKGVEKYPDNVLYRSELKMAEPRHMLLELGTAGIAPTGLVLASLLFAMATMLKRLPRD